MRDGAVDGGDPGEIVPQDPGGAPVSSAVGPALPARGAWGPWATIGWTAILAMVFIGVQVVAAIAYAMVMASVTGVEFLTALGRADSDGTVLGVASLGCALVITGLVVLFVKIRKGPTVRDYLGLYWPSVKTCVGWTVAILVLVAAGDGLSIALGRPLVPDVMVQLYQGASSLPVLWIGVVIGAPIGEEILFRGFLFRGLQHSRLGGMGTVLVTSVVFALIHSQYDAYGMALVLVTGLVLALARLKTGSLLLCMLMHAVTNLVASLEIAIFY